MRKNNTYYANHNNRLKTFFISVTVADDIHYTDQEIILLDIEIATYAAGCCNFDCSEITTKVLKFRLA
jgi:hypothetical protein